MKRTFIALSCLTAVAIATFAEAIAIGTNQLEDNSLLKENVEALSATNGLVIHYRCKNTQKICYFINWLEVIDGELTKEKLPTE